MTLFVIVLIVVLVGEFFLLSEGEVGLALMLGIVAIVGLTRIDFVLGTKTVYYDLKAYADGSYYQMEEENILVKVIDGEKVKNKTFPIKEVEIYESTDDSKVWVKIHEKDEAEKGEATVEIYLNASDYEKIKLLKEGTL